MVAVAEGKRCPVLKINVKNRNESKGWVEGVSVVGGKRTLMSDGN